MLSDDGDLNRRRTGGAADRRSGRVKATEGGPVTQLRRLADEESGRIPAILMICPLNGPVGSSGRNERLKLTATAPSKTCDGMINDDGLDAIRASISFIPVAVFSSRKNDVTIVQYLHLRKCFFFEKGRRWVAPPPPFLANRTQTDASSQALAQENYSRDRQADSDAIDTPHLRGEGGFA